MRNTCFDAISWHTFFALALVFFSLFLFFYALCSPIFSSSTILLSINKIKYYFSFIINSIEQFFVTVFFVDVTRLNRCNEITFPKSNQEFLGKNGSQMRTNKDLQSDACKCEIYFMTSRHVMNYSNPENCFGSLHMNTFSYQVDVLLFDSLVKPFLIEDNHINISLSSFVSSLIFLSIFFKYKRLCATNFIVQTQTNTL